ncbi:MAG: MHYT domain-containing protein [Pseudomonadota bacterium]
MLTPTYDMVLVIASVAVSIMASFTGLILTRGIQALPSAQRKLMIVMASLALGGGIWSMHFVAMLAMNLPVPISYDAVYTLGSALIAVLMCGIGLLIMHFAGRTPLSIAAAGTIMGNGIVVMHYVGMSGIRGCIATFEPTGVVLAVAGATVMGTVALHICYSKRTNARIFTGALVFGLSVVVVHFVAMGWTGLRVGGETVSATPIINHGILALLVMMSAFVICGTFLLTATNFVLAGAAGVTPDGQSVPAAPADDVPDLVVEQQPSSTSAVNPESQPTSESARLPYERDKRTHFIPPRDVVAVRAEGHYSIIYGAEQKLFCPLSISEVERRLNGSGFMRTHRSYLVNINRVSAFERAKDNGRCLFEDVTSLKSAPVSRSFVPKVRTALGI